MTAATSRHPGDAVRVGLGVTALLVTLLAIQRDHLTRFEVDLFRTVNDLPDAYSFLFGPAMQLGNLIAAPVVAVVALALHRRHRRIAVDIFASGSIAWFAAKAVKTLVARPRPGGFVDDVYRYVGGDGLGFVSGHMAVSTAIVAAASPYLPRRLRRLLWAVPLTVGLGRIYYGAHLPLDILGGAAVGWTVAASLHLLLGAPHRTPTLGEAKAALRTAGVDVTAVDRLERPARGSFPFVAQVRGTTRFVKLLDPEPRDRDWIYRAARFLAFRDVRDEVVVADATSQAHREAAMTLLARCHGMRVPAIEAIEAHRGRVWIVEEHIEGIALDRLPVESLSDAVLDGLWAQIRLLRDARIAHRDLVGSNVLVAADGQVWLVDFAHAASSSRRHTLENDVAELLVTTGLLVGPDRAVGAASRVLGPEVVARAVPELQPLVLTAENRSKVRAQPGLLAALRSAASAGEAPMAADHVGGGAAGRGRVAVVGLAVAVMTALVAIAGSSEVMDTLAAPGFRWLGLALLGVVLCPLIGAVALLAGIDRRLALGRTAAALLLLRHGATLDGRAAGRDALCGRLGRAGVPADEAMTAVRRWTRMDLGFSALGAAVGVGIVARNSDAWSLSSDEVGLFALVAGVGFAAELVLRGRPHAARRALSRRQSVPVESDLGVSIVSSASAVAVELLATVAVVFAMGGDGRMSMTAVVLIVGLVTKVAPVAGAPGVAPALLALGLVATGIGAAGAVAAALCVQLLQLWLPIAVGAAASSADDAP